MLTTHLRTAAGGLIVALAASSHLLAPAASASPVAGTAEDGTLFSVESDGRLESGDTAYVAVSAATLWKSPDSPRKVDRPALRTPAELSAWDEALSDTETRRGLTGRSETQALYGDEVVVDTVDGDWAKVSVVDQATPKDDRGYPGWVPVAQLVENDRFDGFREELPTAVVSAEHAEVADPAFLPDGSQPAEALYGAELPILDQDAESVRVALPGGGVGWLPASDIVIAGWHGEVDGKPAETAAPAATGENAVAQAKRFLDTPYLWGGTTPYGFDCSGFTYAVYRSLGVDLPRDSGDQAGHGKAVKSSKLEPGDLLFFASRGGRGSVHHVGMYIGDGKMIHAPNATKRVEIVDWRKWDRGGEFAGARRMV